MRRDPRRWSQAENSGVLGSRCSGVRGRNRAPNAESYHRNNGQRGHQNERLQPGHEALNRRDHLPASHLALSSVVTFEPFDFSDSSVLIIETS